MNIVIITGASSGIGAEFARQLDWESFSVDEFWLIARREQRLVDLSGTLSHKARIFATDVNRRQFYTELAECLQKEEAKIKVLVNAAGYGITGKFFDGDLQEELGMLDVNCRSLTALTKVCLPFMSKNARIIQVASSAAYLPQPRFAVYAASKAYVLSFSRALAEELHERSIYVTALCPGPVSTEFFDIAEKNGASFGFKKYFLMEPEKVVEKAISASKQKRSVVTPGIGMKMFRIFAKLVPQKIVLFFLRFMK